MNKDEKKCVVCGSRNIMAKIEGKYYCFNCGSKIVREKVLTQIKLWKKMDIDKNNRG